MTHVLISSGEVETFPYSLAQLRNDNPQTSFPKAISDALAASFGLYPVTVADRPAHQVGTAAERDAVPLLIAGEWVLGWSQRAKSETELAPDLAARLDEGKAECRRRIFAVVDEMAQINLVAAASTGLLSDAQRAAYIAGLGCITPMRGTWPG
ncbi:hypothetical protein, partial [Pseudophaeobacter leonis]|uniref:hypothetical protein n=1 Tax=Pseudophaeobacter leonis TaxID=1144477 RepID=UPI00111C1459